MSKDVRELVFMALGEASMCWSNIESSGVFQAEKALKVGESLIAALQNKGSQPQHTANTSIMQLLREWLVMEFTDKPLPQPEYDSLIRRTYAVVAQLHN